MAWFPLIAQERAAKPKYTSLQEYQGVYEYSNNSKLKIAASPKDTLLYAIINQSRYPLRYLRKDVFSNASGDTVTFVRNLEGNVSGYTVGKDNFSLISKKVHYPIEMWYPRIGAKGTTSHYQYTQPSAENGLPSGNLKGTGLDDKFLTTMVEKIVDGKYPNVHSILIAKSGKLVFEEYFYEYGKDSLHELRSATKSFVSALVGIAIDKHFIESKDQPVLAYFPGYGTDDPKKQAITIEHMLENRSGLDCDISDPKSVGNETVMNNSEDWVQFTLSLPMSDVPGGQGRYCSGNPIVLGRLVEKAMGMSLPDFAQKNLFSPLGITKYKWNFKPEKANAEDFCQLYLTPRSMMKFGLMYLQKGKWNKKQVVPESWVAQSFTKHSVIQGVNYGYLWWLKYFDANGVRYNGVGAQGNGGQRIYLFPEQDLVVVITGGNYNSKSYSDELITSYILPAFSKKK